MTTPITPPQPEHGTDALAAELVSKSRNLSLGLSVATLILVLFLGIAGYFAISDTSKQSSTDQVNCAVRLLAGPWVGLQSTLDAPVGDVTARELAAKRMGVAIEKLKRIDDYC